MDIPALSVAMAQGQLKAQFATGLASEVMDMAEVSGQNMIDMLDAVTTSMEKSVQPHIGGNIDILL